MRYVAEERADAVLAPSFLAWIGHPANDLQALRVGLDRFTFLLGGSDSEQIVGPGRQ